jgi:uncharacterized protein (TIGR02271 family)
MLLQEKIFSDIIYLLENFFMEVLTLMNFLGFGKGANDTDNENTENQNAENQSTENTSEGGTLQLREEQLDVNKSKVQTGEVILSKDVVEEQKSIDVPVTHEEVVIERRSFDNKQSDSPITSGETIHIPVSEERVNVDKHTVLTGEVSANKQEVEETKHIEQTVKKEEAHIDSTGDTKVTTT